MKNKLEPWLTVLAVVALFVGSWVWGYLEQDKRFECHARVYSKLIANTYNKSRVVDVFLSLHGDGKGYLLVSGTYSVPKAPLVKLDSVVNFTYAREGSFRSLHLDLRTSAVIEFFEVLKYDDIKIEFTRVDSHDYLVSSPIETLMLYTVD